MRPDPEPNEPVSHLSREGSIVQADTRRSKPADFLEMKGWMLGILLETGKGFIGSLANFVRKSAIESQNAVEA